MIDKLTIAVRDGPAMAAFYQDVVGAVLTAKAYGPDVVWIGVVGELELWLIPQDLVGVSSRESLVVARFAVADVEAAVVAAGRAGGTRLADPVVIGERTLATVLDPDGHPLELSGPRLGPTA
jgi:predicted enzyme related to lactoylglutathione lyase